MRRLVCVIEGHGERESVPILCNRILRALLQDAEEWYVDEDPVRQPRSRLVTSGGPNVDGVRRALALAVARSPNAILFLCDGDDDCPAQWGPAMPTHHLETPIASVMALREYESWLLWSHSRQARERVRAKDPERSPRDAKSALSALVPGYSPTTHQRDLTRKLDLEAAWTGSTSFDKLVRSLARLTGAKLVTRPSPK